MSPRAALSTEDAFFEERDGIRGEFRTINLDTYEVSAWFPLEERLQVSALAVEIDRNTLHDAKKRVVRAIRRRIQASQEVRALVLDLEIALRESYMNGLEKSSESAALTMQDFRSRIERTLR